MCWHVTKVLLKQDYTLYVELQNGDKGIFDMKPYLDFGIFKELKDVSYFNKVYIIFGAITWPNEQDIAPQTLLDGLQKFDYAQN